MLISPCTSCTVHRLCTVLTHNTAYFSLLAGTAAVMIWSLKVIGKRAHSSLPHRGINSLELAMDAVEYIQKRFYQDFPPVSVIINIRFNCAFSARVTLIIDAHTTLFGT